MPCNYDLNILDLNHACGVVKNYEIKLKMLEKLYKKNTQKNKFQLNIDYLWVQRLSAAVSGKTKKFSMVGPCEFVPFNRKDDITLESIKQLFRAYQSNKISPRFICDVLSGERGPSC